MQIVELVPEQVESILPFITEFANIVPNVEFNSGNYIKFWRNALTSGLGVIFVSVDSQWVIKGGIGGIKYPELLTGNLMAVELFWYTKKDERGDGLRLYKKFEQWAKDQQCKKIAMIHLMCSMPAKLQHFYERSGFTLLEMHYEKVL